jgi:uroporphyrinogen decarboxylase
VICRRLIEKGECVTGRERTLNFIAGNTVDHPPFHPIIMRWAAQYAGVKYGKFCQDYREKCAANIRCAEDFGIDWVTVLSDPYVEAQAFGVQVDFPEDDLPLERGGLLEDLNDAGRIRPYRVKDHARLMNRVNEVRQFKKLTGDQYFIVGWVEGAVAEYGDIRGLSNAALDFYDESATVHKIMDIIADSAIHFITEQINAGADCIGIGDAFCSQIGPDLYREFAFEREKRLVDHIHSLGALAKLHICGNTSSLIPDMIKTGADILDIDHLVPSMVPFVSLLGPHQVFSGKSDPVAIIQNGNEAVIRESVRRCNEEAMGRCIVSSGCEVPPGTPIENMESFSTAARSSL